MIALTCAVLLAGLPGIAHEFVYEADRDRKSVAVAGTFNNWDKGANFLKADGRRWKTTLILEPGRHQYKFVLDGSDWITDPKAAKNEDDGNGNVNSILELIPADYAKPAVRGDGTIAKSALEHKTQAPGFNYDRGMLSMSFRARAGDLEGVTLKLNGKSFPMTLTGGDSLYETYRVRAPWNRRDDLSYVFVLLDGKEATYGSDGLSTRPFTIKASEFRPFEVPSWAEGRVFYQIFPERFANGDSKNDPAGTLPWGSHPTYANFMGGDVAGIEAKAAHLEQLGLGGIYLNPIFESPSNHGYETTDYHSVAKRFGTNADLSRLVSNLHRRGMKVVLDGVFNHTATNFAPFADLVQKGKDSRYLGWYWVHSFPVKVQNPPNYTAWFNYPSMPKVNLSNPEARRFMLDVPAFWKRTANIDGWRLDVANEVTQDFWRDFRKAVRKADPEGWIVGEVWGDGSQWLAGDQWDSIMGYQFRDAALRFVAEGKIGPTEFMGRLLSTYASYAPQVSRNLMNLLSSHDTPRFLTLCGGDEDLARLGAALQFTWPGTPSIYYGEELGMKGGADPENRRCMQWELATGDNRMLSFYKKIIQLRNRSKALQVGDPTVLQTDDTAKTLAFARILDDEIAVVAANRSDLQQTVTIQMDSFPEKLKKLNFADELTQSPVSVRSGSLSITLAPRSAAVLLPKSGASTRFVRDASRASARRLGHPSVSLRRTP